MTEVQSIEAFRLDAQTWLNANAAKRNADDSEHFSVAVFHDLSFDEERQMLDDLAAWQQQKAEAGYHAVTLSPNDGGLGQSELHAIAFGALEGDYDVPPRHELFSVTTGLVAPTVDEYATPDQRDRFFQKFLRAEEFCSQLFSEPNAGSDLAGLACRATRDGDEWIIEGQKVWSSGAQFGQWGLLIARHDPDLPKHRGMTAFLVPLDAEGVEVRPIKQMSGGTSFNEVFLSGVRVGDDLRLGPVGDGWKVALTTLGHERSSSARHGGRRRPGGSIGQVVEAAIATGQVKDPVMRDQLMDVYIYERVRELTNQRVRQSQLAGAVPGPELSIGKLAWTIGMGKISDVMSSILGSSLIADTGPANGYSHAYAWGEHVLGAPGYRIAGGSDEVQRNIIGERVLGLPSEPRSPKDIPWKDIPR